MCQVFCECNAAVKDGKSLPGESNLTKQINTYLLTAFKKMQVACSPASELYRNDHILVKIKQNAQTLVEIKENVHRRVNNWLFFPTQSS